MNRGLGVNALLTRFKEALRKHILGVMRTIVRSGQAASGPPLGPCPGREGQWMSYFLKQVAGIQKGAGKSRPRDSWDAFEMQNASLNMVTKSIISSARSWNIEIVNNL
uniref:Uncharacterized protein n=1 Tax=Oncorhynchus mykiss TaxID=8022 RepID=A0A8C7LSF9_ONCMY